MSIRTFLTNTIRRHGKRAFAAIMALVLLLTGIPFWPGGQLPKAWAGTDLTLTPNSIEVGGTTKIEFSFNDSDVGQTEHQTDINLCEANPAGGAPIMGQLIASGKYATKAPDGTYAKHTIDWPVKDAGGANLPSGTYFICVSPSIPGQTDYYGKMAQLYVYDPGVQALQPPTLRIVPNLNSDTHVLEGETESNAKVTITFSYIARVGLKNQYAGTATAETTADGSGKWSLPWQLPAYQIAEITAQAEKEQQPPAPPAPPGPPLPPLKSPPSDPLTVLRFQAPNWNIPWISLAGYYYQTVGLADIEKKVKDVSGFNGYPVQVCVDNEACLTNIPAGTNLLLMDPAMAGLLGGADLEELTLEKIKNRKGYYTPENADPVNLATGDFSFIHTNMSLQAAIPLEFAVTYHSRDAYEGMLGVGWHHSLEWALYRWDQDHIHVVTPDGASYDYAPLAGGGYLTPKGTYNTLIRQNDGTYVLETPKKQKYVFREDGQLYKIADENGNEIRLSYRGSVLVKAETEGASLSFAYDQAGKITRIVDHTGRSVQYRYDGQNRNLTKIILPDDAAISFKYDDMHRMTEVTNPNETQTLVNQYDAEGRVVHQKEFNGEQWDFAYAPNPPVGGLFAGGKSATTDSLGRVKTFEYDERFRQTAIYYPDGTTERFAYDDNDNLTERTDANGNTTRYFYDALGNLTQMTDPLGATTKYAYNQWNKPVVIEDALGHQTTLGYDAKGNLTSVTDALGKTSHVEVDARGIPVKVTNPLGETFVMENDAAGFAKAVTDPAGFKQELTRDALHRITEIKDALANISRIEYDPRDRVKARVDAMQQRETFAYDKDSNLIGHVDASGAATAYEYDTYRRVKSVTDALGQKRTFGYDAVGNLTEVTDPRGAVTKYRYNLVDRVEAVIDPEGNETKLTYDANGNVLTREDPRGGLTRIRYDKRNRPVEITDANGAVTTYAYDLAGRLIEETNALGFSVRYEYDALGRLVKTTDALLQATSYAYDDTGRLQQITKPNGAVWTLQYDARGLLKGTVDPLGNVRALERDALGRVSVSRDEAGHATTYGYDPLGRVTSILDALNHKTEIGYDPLGRVKQIKDANSRVTSYDYDAIGRLLKVTNALGAETAYAYDPAGNITSKTDALQRVTRYLYNLNGQLTQEVNPLAEVTKLDYDGNGNTVRVHYPDNKDTLYQYDKVNRLTEIRYTDNRKVEYGYDLLGRRTSMKDSLGTTAYAYDALNQLTNVTDARGKTIRYEWTATGQRSKLTDPDGKTVTYEYDLLDRMIKVTDSQGLSTKYDYDARGLLVGKHLPTYGNSTYRYNALGQMLEIRHANQHGKIAEHLMYEYDPVGNRTRVTRGEDGNDEDDGDTADHPDSMVTDYAYDALNQLTLVKTYNGNDPVTTGYTYDAVGNRLTKQTVLGSLTDVEQYAYDAADKLLHWQSDAGYKDFAYDLRGNLLKVTGVVLDNADEHDGQSLSSLALFGGSSVPSNVYGSVYYPVTEVAPFATPSASLDGPKVLEQYVWNSANLLQKHINAKGDVSQYEYDGDGNRTKLTVDVAAGPKGNKGNNGNGHGNGNGNGNGHGKGRGNGKGNGNGKCHVVPPGFIPPGLAKKCGQVEEPYPDMHPGGPREGWEKQYKKKHWEFNYTNDVSLALPEPIMVTEADETSWKETYVYGAGGERISMTYLPAYDSNNGWEPTPGAGGAEPGTAPRTLFYMNDALGSTLGLIEKDGRVSSRYHYDEFGTPLDAKKFDPNWPGPDNLFGYTGLGYNFYDGMTYARARYYKPELGRFISEDTYKGRLWEPQSLNLYTYVHNNPLLWIDPSGHLKDSFGAALPVPSDPIEAEKKLIEAKNNWNHAQRMIQKLRGGESTGTPYNKEEYWTAYQASMHDWAEKIRSGIKVADSLSVKLEGSASLFAGGKLGVEVKGHTVKLYFTRSGGSSVGAGGGLMFNHTMTSDINGEMSASTTNAGISGGAILIGELTYKSDQKYVEISEGVGLGGGVSLDLIPLGGSFEREYSTSYDLPFDVTRNRIITLYPAYDGAASYAEWDNMFSDEGW